ncbi:MAG: lipoate--protein ligase family protein [Cyanobacteria bacterium J06642_11]
MTPWRLIPLLDAPGPVQMAIDSWLLQQQLQGHPPTLRFYTWNPLAISLGRSQRRRVPDHWRSLTWQGQPIELVQRPSGGRGVLHQGDLTYALVTQQPSPNRVAGYRALCEFLIVGWAKLGVDLQFGAPDRSYIKSDNCFGLATTADLIDNFGNKFIGSAQYYQKQWVLQHGSMLLNPDPGLFMEVFGQHPPQIPALIKHGITDQIPEIISTLTAAATTCFDAVFQVKPLTSGEWTEINALVETTSISTNVPDQASI